MLLLSTILTVVQTETAREQGDAAAVNELRNGSRDMLMVYGLHPALYTLGHEGLEQSEKLKELAPQIKAGTFSFKGAFPEVAAYYERIGGGAAPALPALVAVAPPSVETTQPSIAAPTIRWACQAAIPWRASIQVSIFHLKLEGSMGAYTGTITQSERTYPVRLSGDAGNLSGSFEVNGGGFDATMKILGDDVIFTTGRME